MRNKGAGQNDEQSQTTGGTASLMRAWFRRPHLLLSQFTARSVSNNLVRPTAPISCLAFSSVIIAAGLPPIIDLYLRITALEYQRLCRDCKRRSHLFSSFGSSFRRIVNDKGRYRQHRDVPHFSSHNRLQKFRGSRQLCGCGPCPRGIPSPLRRGSEGC
jgi:hypothetical protein